MVRKKNRRSNRKKGGMMTAATRFKKFNNPKSNQIKSLFNTILNGKGPLSMEMKTFIATPWCQCGVDNRWQACSDCNIPTDKIPPQSHGGNLFEHSQWSSLYLLLWLNNRGKQPILTKILQKIKSSPELKSIVTNTERFILMCGFFHDIGKYGTDKSGNKVTDLYDKECCGGYGPEDHPKNCKKIIMKPGNSYGGKLKSVLDILLSGCSDPTQARKILALIARTHWEFGKLNIPVDYGGITVSQYVNFIRKSIKSIHSPWLRDKQTFHILISLCMVVSCSDVAAAYNRELVSGTNKTFFKSNGITVAKHLHNTDGGPWIKFGFREKCSDFLTKVLDFITKDSFKLTRRSSSKSSKRLTSKKSSSKKK